MYFRNACIFQRVLPGDDGALSLSSRLAAAPFAPCTAMDSQTRGFVPHNDGDLVHTVQGEQLFTLRTETKIIPSATVARLARERADALSKQEDRVVGRKEMREIKAIIVDELLPKALTRQTDLRAWRSSEWLVVDTASTGKAEDLISAMDRCYETPPKLRPFRTRNIPSAVMETWLTDGAPDGFTIDRDIELRSVEREKSAVRYTRKDPGEDALRELLSQGMVPSWVAMTWRDKISVILLADGRLKRIHFLDVLRESVQDQENAQDLFDAEMTLFTSEMKLLLADLVAALGGVAE